MLAHESRSQGVYTHFGENRVVYNNFIWEKINSGYDEIIYEKGQSLMAETMLQQFDIEKKGLEREMQFQLRSAIRVVIFTNFAHYIQGNFGISDQQFYAGGYIYTPQNTIFVYFNGDYSQLNKDIKRGIAKAMINEMVLGGTMLERVQSSALITLPEWFVSGLASYLAESWSTYHDNLMRDALFQKTFKSFTSLDKDMSVFAGHSIWFFLENKYGKSKIRSILFNIRITRNVQMGLEAYTGLSVNTLLKEWLTFFKNRYAQDEVSFTDPRGEESKLNQYAKIRHTGMKLSPDGKHIAFVTNNRGAYKVWIYNIAQRSAKLLLADGNKTFTREPNYFFPVVKWITKNKVAILQESSGILTLTEYLISGRKVQKLDLSEFDWVRDFDFNEEGDMLAVAAVKDGILNLFAKQRKEKSFKQLTANLYDISEISFTKDNNILFVSTAPGSEILNMRFALFNAARGVFYFDIEHNKITRITPVDYQINYSQPIHLGDNLFSFISDVGGIHNSYLVEFKGQTLQYKDFKQLTNYSRSILFQSASIENSKIAELVYIRGKYRIYLSNYSLDEMANTNYATFTQQTQYRKEVSANKDYLLEQTYLAPIVEIPADSTQRSTTLEDSVSILQPSFQTYFPIIDYKTPDKPIKQPKASLDFGNEVNPLVHVDYFLLRFLDNSIIGDYYFQGGINERIFHSTLFSPHITFSLSDMFNNHTIQAGVRIMGTLDGSDYYFKYKNRIGRLNKEVFFNRRSRYFDANALYQRNIFTQGGVGIEYPFSDRARIEAQVLYRTDIHANLAVDSESLFHQDPKQSLIGTKLGYVFDNTVSTGLNMLQGTRINAFVSPYFVLNRKGANIMMGLDFRNYTKIDRQLIWANRFVANTSIGALKTAYFLGGPENWYYRTFEGNVGSLRNKEYILQTIGAPIRGFPLNARSGTSYMVINSELRLPVFAYLTQKPIRAEWIRSFMLVAFADMGAAWMGSNPYSSLNPYNTIVYNQPDMDMSVTSNRNPFILGTGFGARIKLDSYYFKYDVAWGMMADVPTRVFQHISLGLDF